METSSNFISSRNILKMRLIFYEDFMGGQGRVGGQKFYFWEGGLDMDIFI